MNSGSMCLCGKMLQGPAQLSMASDTVWEAITVIAAWTMIVINLKIAHYICMIILPLSTMSFKGFVVCFFLPGVSPLD